MSNFHLRYHFTPKWVPTIVTLLLLPIFIALGFWQLHRAEFKQQLQTAYQQRQQAAPLTLAAVANATIADLQYYPIQITGHFDNAHPILLDNKIYQHRPGYQVLLPFIPTATTVENPSHQAILVNLGWIPQGKTRAEIPVIAKIKGQQHVLGIIQIPAKKEFNLGAIIEQQANSWSLRIEQVHHAQLEKHLGYTLFPFTVLLSPRVNYGYVREWSPVEMKAYMHKGYAVQWFALAVTLVIVYIVVNTKRKEP